MKAGYTHISVVLDRSGSMSSIASDTIGGFNTFLKSQQEAPGEATFSLTQFDTQHELNYSFVPVKDVPALNGKTFVPRGGTALYDAIGLTIVGCGEKLAAMDEANRPEKVILVILTDGEENSSREYSYQMIQEMIKKQQDVFSWEFVFLGANIDAKRIGTNLGIKGGNSMTFMASAKGVGSTFESMSANMTSYRGMSAQECKTSAFFNAADEQKQAEAGVK
jgi:hypothetical protein